MKWFALGLIRLYQHLLSPIMGRQCRFQPTCSHYSYEAIQKYGLITGGKLAIKRIISCRPGGKHGFDPVPDLNKDD